MKSKFLYVIMALVMLSASTSYFAYADNGYESGVVTFTTTTTTTTTTGSIVVNEDPNDIGDDDTTTTTEPETTTTTTQATTAKPKVALSKCSISNIIAKTYTGKAIGQAPVIKYGKVTLKNGTDYSVSYKNNVAIGTASVIITGKGNYTGKVTRGFNILPKNCTGFKAVAKKSKKIKVTWKKQTAQTAGYHIQYSTSPNFNSKDTRIITVKGAKKTSYTIKGLKKKKIYYVRIRTYKMVGNKAYGSLWSSAKKIKAK